MLDLGRYFSCSQDLGFVTDVHGSVLAVTPGAERALGYSQAELKGVDLSSLDESGDLRRFFESSSTRSRMNLGFLLRTRAGAVLSLGAMASCLRDEEGTTRGWFLAAQDLNSAVSESRQAPTILDALVDSLGAAAWSFDRNGTVVTWGRTCEAAFGIPRAQAEGRLPAEKLFADAGDYRRVLDAVDREGWYSGELPLIAASRGVRVNHVSVTPLVAHGRPLGYTCVSFDVTERKREEELRRAHFEQAGEAIVVVDLDLRRVIDVNRRACDIYGYSREEFLNQSVADLRPPSPWVSDDEIARSLREKGAYESDDEAGIRKDGTRFPCALNIRFFAVAGKGYTIAVLRDLTAQRRAEEFFRVLFERAADAIFLVEDQTQKIVEANHAACRMLGYTREEFLGLKVPDLVPPELRHRIAGVRKNLAEGGYQRDRRLLLRKNGTSVPTDHAITRLDVGGRIFYLASSRDLTEHEASAQELAEAKTFLEHLQENASDGIALLDDQGTLLSVNQRLLSIVGVRREDMLGQRYQDLADPAVREEGLHHWARLMKGEQVSMRTTIRRTDGRSVVCDVSSAPVRRGDRTFVFAIIRDVTAEAQAREELERRVAERAAELRRSEERFRAAFAHGGIGMALVSLDGRFLQVNRAFLELIGYPEEELLQKTFLEITHPEDRERSVELARRMIRDRQPFARLEKRYLRRDGRTVWLDLSTTLVHGPSGEDLYFVSSFQDVTDRKHAEEELRHSEARFRAITEAMPVPATITRPDGRILFVNDSAARLFGLGREEALGRLAADFYGDPADRDRMRDRLLRDGELSGYELLLRRADGARFWTVVNLRVVTFEDGPAIFASFVDIDARKRAELELRESEERFRAITEGVPVSVVIARASDGTILYGNEQAAESLGLAPGGLAGRSVPEFLARPEQRALLQERLQGAGSVQGEEIQFRRANGELFWGAASLRLASLRGEPVTLGVFSDITARKASEVLLKKAHEELEQRVLERTAELARANELLQEEVVERKRAENALRLIVEGTAAATGSSFFRSLVRHLASALNVRCAMVARRSAQGPGAVTTIAFWNGSEFIEPVERGLAGTPCEDVIQGEACGYGHDVQRLFPQDRLLAELGAECYLGVPILDSSGSVVGVLSVADVHPASDEERKLSILKIFAARVGGELERQQGEEALRESEERWRSLVQNAPDYILTVDREGRILSVNRTAPGLRIEQFLGKPMMDFIPPANQEVVRRSLDAVFRDGTPSSYETRAPGRDGGLTWYYTRVGPVVVRGEVVGATLIATDVSERRQAERLQRVQYETTRVLAEAASLETAIREILARVGETMGWKVGLFWRAEGGALRQAEAWAVPGPGFQEFVEACRGRAPIRGRGACGRAWKEGAPSFVPDVQKSDEFERPEAAARALLRGSVAVALIDGGAVLGVLEFFTEEIRQADEALDRTLVTLSSQIGQFLERKRAEEALRFQKSLLESQSEAALDGILVVSREGVMMSFNRRFSQIWEIPEDILRSRTDERALQFVLDKLSNPAEFLSRVRYLYEHPNEESRDELRLKDGRTLDRYSAPVKGEQGALYGRVWYFRDVTGRKQTEENLRRAAAETRRAYDDLKEAQAQLIRSEKLASIGMLVSGVAHEINNPLNVMYGNLQLLAEASDLLLPLAREGARSKKIRGVASRVARSRGMIRDALKAARHAREIVRDFRNFARDTRTAELVDLNECLEEAVTLIQRELRPDIRVVRKLGRIPQVRCLRGQMSQVFLNLLKNAGEAIEKKGTITLRTQKRDGCVVVEVADTGRGMPEEVRRKLFEPFFTTKPVGKGLGLGLSISAMIVQNHNGRITVRSRPGRGSVFKVELPLSVESAGPRVT